MKTFKIIAFITMLSSFIFFIDSSIIYAHSGRTDSNGCHTDHKTGSFHCHNGESSNSSSSGYDNYTESTYDYTFEDNDENGENDFEQDWDELAENLKEIGEEEGYNDAEVGLYNIDKYDLSNAEFSWYKIGYEEGYNQRYEEIKAEARDKGYESGLKNQTLVIPTKYKLSEEIQDLYKTGFSLGQQEKIAREEGYEIGLKTDELVVPSNFIELESVKKAYERGVIEGQIERWKKIAEERVENFEPLSLHNSLPEEVKEKVQEHYDKVSESLKEATYEEGYKSTFKTDSLIIPDLYNSQSELKEQFQRGFSDNKQIKDYKNEASNAGRDGEEYDVPHSVKKDGAESIYEKYYNQGKRERILDTFIKAGFLFILLLTLLVVYWFKNKKPRKIL